MTISLFIFAFVVAASGIDVKVATVAPQGSPWDNGLRELAAKWLEISTGDVHLRIYPSGIAGDESDLVRKMRLHQLAGAGLTQVALAEIVPGVLALSAPFLIRSGDEFSYLMGRIQPELDAEFERAGYRILAWSEVGWIRFFGADSIRSPSELARLKLAVPPSDEMLQIWRKLGYPAFALATIDYSMGLQTRMVESLYAPPAVVAAFGWHGLGRAGGELAIGRLFSRADLERVVLILEEYRSRY